MNKAIQKRLANVEKIFRIGRHEVNVIIIINDPDEVDVAAAGDLHWHREPNESFKYFKERATAAAIATGKRQLLVSVAASDD